MRRGDIVAVAAGSGFGGKPRPALIIQSNGFGSLPTVVVALFTSTLTDAPAVRSRFMPDAVNGLRRPSDLMADIFVTVRRDQIGELVGRLEEDELARADRAISSLLGFAE